MPPKTPDPVARPKLARWLWDRKISTSRAAEALGVTPQAVRRYLLEFGHPSRQIPARDVMAKIRDYTDGEVTADDFHWPEPEGAVSSPEARP